MPRKNEGTDEGNGETPSSSNVGNTEPNGEVVSQHLKAELEEKEAELQRAKMDNSCLAADCQGLKAELKEKEAELEDKEAELTRMFVCDWEIDSGVEWGLGDSEDRI